MTCSMRRAFLAYIANVFTPKVLSDRDGASRPAKRQRKAPATKAEVQAGSGHVVCFAKRVELPLCVRVPHHVAASRARPEASVANVLGKALLRKIRGTRDVLRQPNKAKLWASREQTVLWSESHVRAGMLSHCSFTSRVYIGAGILSPPAEPGEPGLAQQSHAMQGEQWA